MRRLKRSDPAFAIFEAYAAEHTERWAGAKALTMDEALAEMPEVERKYQLECQEYGNVLYGISEEFTGSAKLELEQIAKLADAGELQGKLDTGALVAVADGACVTSADELAKSAHEFESQRDKAVDSIMAIKMSLDKKE